MVTKKLIGKYTLFCSQLSYTSIRRSQTLPHQAIIFCVLEKQIRSSIELSSRCVQPAINVDKRCIHERYTLIRLHFFDFVQYSKRIYPERLC